MINLIKRDQLDEVIYNVVGVIPVVVHITDRQDGNTWTELRTELGFTKEQLEEIGERIPNWCILDSSGKWENNDWTDDWKLKIYGVQA